MGIIIKNIIRFSIDTLVVTAGLGTGLHVGIRVFDYEDM